MLLNSQLVCLFNLSLLCLVDIFVSFSLSGMPENYLGVAKRIDHDKQHLNILTVDMFNA